ncbi:hypothetical protein GIB67_012209, partial [Kingdonia uniflora]
HQPLRLRIPLFCEIEELLKSELGGVRVLVLNQLKLWCYWFVQSFSVKIKQSLKQFPIQKISCK